MLGLKLRDEFLGEQMAGTAIELRTPDNQGAAQKSPEQILSITYPTADVQLALAALQKGRVGVPVVLVGDRGRGKSHIMAVMHHAIKSPDVVENWIHEWGNKLDVTTLQHLELVKGYFPISEPVHNQEYPFLWDLIFDRHPNGQYYRGQFENMAQNIPPRSLLQKMFEDQPTCLILDEVQTWFEGLPKERKGRQVKAEAFNFIQMLSEIATDLPQIFIFVASVLGTSNEAYQQLHRNSPILINFHGATAKQDRLHLLLHRLFENRANIASDEIVKIANVYANERFRLLFSDKSEHEKGGLLREVAESWPFAPELIDLLEDHILMAQNAQNTRDLIRILAQAYRSRGEAAPVVTPADFFVDGDHEAAQVLVNAVAANDNNQAKLIEVAQRNLKAVRDAGVNVAHDRDVISAIWMYSLALGQHPGIPAPKLHTVITREKAIDDNTFQAGLARLIENSMNIHGDGVGDGRLRFELQENPRSKVKAYAKNAKLWDAAAVASPGQTVFPAKDIEHIRKTLKAIFVPEGQSSVARIIVLGPNWRDKPWEDVEEADQPAKWDNSVLLVIPEKFSVDRTIINATLGGWLAKHVTKRRNTVRFLLGAPDVENLFLDKELIFLARCSYLCSKNAWGADGGIYYSLRNEFDRPLRNALQGRFTRFAIVRQWDYQQAKNCVFDVERFTEQGGDIPKAVEQKIATDLFDQTAFRNLVSVYAQDGEFVSSLFDGLAEPPAPGGGEAIPWLGEIGLYEQLLQFAAEGKIALNVGGTWIVRRPEETSFEDALRFFRNKAYRSQQENRNVQLGLPGVAGAGAIAPPPVAQPTPPGTQPSDGAPMTPVYPETPPMEGSPLAEPTTEPRIIPEIPSFDDAVPPPPITKKTDAPISGINLSGCFETWGIPDDQGIDSVKVEFTGLTPRQMKQILIKIPSAFKAMMEISYKDGEKQ
jgi:hypothetical protein